MDEQDAAGYCGTVRRTTLEDMDTTATTTGTATTTTSAGHDRVAHVGPNWFATVMGTGIVANAAATLPVHVPGLLDAARAVWVLDVVLLVVLLAATAAHWRHHPVEARGHLDDPVLGHFYGAPAMALMTVGAGALLVGTPLVGTGAAVALEVALWTAGTLLGLWTAVALPVRTFTRADAAPDAASGAWLMPVVPPMVSAATGPLLVPHLTPAWGQAVQLLCTAMFGLALVASLVVVTLVWSRLAHHGLGAAAAAPTVWIVLGPLGQSVTAAHALGATAGGVLPAAYAHGFVVLALVYGLPVWGFAMLWLAVAVSLTVHVLREGLPFSLTWWSFTFPLGTVVTGTSALAAVTGAPFLVVVATVLYAALVVAWLVVAARTLAAIASGALPAASPTAPARVA
ncbi:TDT family transporter [Nocardioides korecus]